jgi:shikimate kinase
MGCGKSTLGNSLANALNLNWIDLDDEFEARYKISIPDFFSKYGEGAFRELEQKLLVDFSTMPDTVISTGGGLPCFFENMGLMNQTGITVYLKADSELILSRLSTSGRKRPLFQPLNNKNIQKDVIQHLKSREPFYEKAHLTFNAADPDIQALQAKIQEFYNRLT